MPAFQGLAIAPQLEKISLDQCQLSLFRSLRTHPLGWPSPYEAKVLNCYEGLSAGSEDTTSSLYKIAATMHCLAIN